jgi:hypothetical protein
MYEIHSKIGSTLKSIASKNVCQVTHRSFLPYLLYQEYESNKRVKYPAPLMCLGAKRSEINEQSEIIKARPKQDIAYF